MLTEEQIQEIREHLEKAQNPLFFFDNDADGLCSFLLLRRFIGRGRGVAIKSFPDLQQSYAKKIHELSPDYVFILDKPIVSEGFLKEAEELAVPVVWIDHHDADVPIHKSPIFWYYNSMKSKNPSSEPVTFWAYRVSKKKEDLWIALSGCISDGYLPEFAKTAEKEYPELWSRVGSAFEGLYETGIGKVSRILGFALKDRTSSVVKMIKFLFNASVQDVLHDNKKNTLLERFNQVDKLYQKLMEKARVCADESKLLYFQYGGELSLSADIANELFYRFPEKVIVVAYISGTKANLSLRGESDVRELTLKAIEGIEGARGGGHKHATGAQVSVEDVPRFKENLEKLLGK